MNQVSLQSEHEQSLTVLLELEVLLLEVLLLEVLRLELLELLVMEALRVLVFLGLEVLVLEVLEWPGLVVLLALEELVLLALRVLEVLVPEVLKLPESVVLEAPELDIRALEFETLELEVLALEQSPLSPQQLREWLASRTPLRSRAAGAGGTTAGGAGAGGTRAGGARAEDPGAGGAGSGGAAAGGTGAGGPGVETVDPGIGDPGAGAAGFGDAAAGGTEAGGPGAGAVDPGVGDPGAEGAVAGGAGAGGPGAGTVDPRVGDLKAGGSCSGGAAARGPGAGGDGARGSGDAGGAGAAGACTGGAGAGGTAQPRLFFAPSSPSTLPPPDSVLRPLVDFAAACRLDYAASLVAESASACPPSVGGECALSTVVLEDRKEDFECFAAAVPHLVSMLIAPEGDPDAPDLPLPRSYAKAIEGPYSSQWQPAMDAEMASWKSTSTYAPREWHDTLRTTLVALGFAPLTADPSLFLRTDTSLPPFYILVYVDDLVFATADTKRLAHLKSELQKRHTCTDVGELRSYLGLQITQD
ncbi:unnamed protein product [Closterium sp. NIES-65]|nr:unnamed protein product [Closterium sp. NIES-65]